MSFWFDLMMAGTSSGGGGGGSGIIIFVGEDGTISTSASGTTFTAQTSTFGSSDIRAVAASGGVAICVGNDGVMNTASTPYSTWSNRTNPFGGADIFGVATNGSLWTAVGEGGLIATAATPSGTWTLGTGVASDAWSVCFGASRWAAITGTRSIGSGQIIAATTPGGTWTNYSTPDGGVNAVEDLIFAGGLFVAVLTSGGIYTTTNPTSSWTLRATLPQFTGGGIGASAPRLSYANGLFFVAYTRFPGGQALYSSASGTSWSAVTSPAVGNKAYTLLGFTSGLYVAGGSNGDGKRSSNYITWTTQSIAFSGKDVNGVAVG